MVVYIPYHDYSPVNCFIGRKEKGVISADLSNVIMTSL